MGSPGAKRTNAAKSLSDYPHVFQLYLKPPKGNVSLEELEKMVFDRLNVLKTIEAQTLVEPEMYSEKWKALIFSHFEKTGLHRYINLIQSTGENSETDADLSMRHEDVVSHFTLRMCFCQSDQEQAWLIKRETELLKFRYLYLGIIGLKRFININNLQYISISEEEKASLKQYLLNSATNFDLIDFIVSDFYKVPFEQVPDLVSEKKVFLKAGYAYVPNSELASCFQSLLRDRLIYELNMARSRISLLKKTDERIKTIAAKLKDMNIVKGTYSNRIKLDDLEHLSKQSFPLCMLAPYEHVKKEHHLRYFGRLQFGLYLKGIGLSLEDSIKYWQKEFTKKIDEETFTKRYLYYIKHSYGTVGGMINAPPKGCAELLATNVGVLDCHGCPFKFWDSQLLEQKMTELGINENGVKEVLEEVENKAYQSACFKYFKHTHGGQESEQFITHPNQYFEESFRITNGAADFCQEVHQTQSSPSSSWMDW